MKNSIFPHSGFQYQSVGLVKGVYIPTNKKQNKGKIIIDDIPYLARVMPKLAIFSSKKDLFKKEEENTFITWLRFCKNKKYPYLVLKHLISQNTNPSISEIKGSLQEFSVFGELTKLKHNQIVVKVKRNIAINKNKNKEQNLPFTIPIEIDEETYKRIKKAKLGSLCQTRCKLTTKKNLVMQDILIRPNLK